MIVLYRSKTQFSSSVWPPTRCANIGRTSYQDHPEALVKLRNLSSTSFFSLCNGKVVNMLPHLEVNSNKSVLASRRFLRCATDFRVHRTNSCASGSRLRTWTNGDYPPFYTKGFLEWYIRIRALHKGRRNLWFLTEGLVTFLITWPVQNRVCSLQISSFCKILQYGFLRLSSLTHETRFCSNMFNPKVFAILISLAPSRQLSTSYLAQNIDLPCVGDSSPVKSAFVQRERSASSTRSPSTRDFHRMHNRSYSCESPPRRRRSRGIGSLPQVDLPSSMTGLGAACVC